MRQAIKPTLVWRQVWGIAALVVAMNLAWMAYGYYQPEILRQVGLVQIAGSLSIIQALLGVVLEPLAGNFSDRMLQRYGNRLPIIAAGVTSAGLIFTLISWILEGQVILLWHGIVPILMTAWVISMVVFRGPVIATMRQLVATENLPKANALLTFVFLGSGALNPLITKFLRSQGASQTFLAGSIALLVGATLFWLLTIRGDRRVPSENTELESAPESMSDSLVYTLAIFSLGFSTFITVNWLLALLPGKLASWMGGLSAEVITSFILLVAAIAAIPIEQVSSRIGLRRAMLGGLFGFLAVGWFVLFFSASAIAAWGLAIAAGICLSLVFTSMIPVVLTMRLSGNAGLATGLYFSGGSLANVLPATSLLHWSWSVPFAVIIVVICLRDRIDKK